MDDREMQRACTRINWCRPAREALKKRTIFRAPEKILVAGIVAQEARIELYRAENDRNVEYGVKVAQRVRARRKKPPKVTAETKAAYRRKMLRLARKYFNRTVTHRSGQYEGVTCEMCGERPAMSRGLCKSCYRGLWKWSLRCRKCGHTPVNRNGLCWACWVVGSHQPPAASRQPPGQIRDPNPAAGGGASELSHRFRRLRRSIQES